MYDDRTINAARLLNLIAGEAAKVVRNPSEVNLDFLNEALTEYESGDGYDFVTDVLAQAEKV